MQLDIAIVGSGPAGVTASRAFIEGGHSVAMFEAGDWSPAKTQSQSWVDFRNQSVDQWEILIGEYSQLSDQSRRSVKLSVPWIAELLSRAQERLAYEAGEFFGGPFAAVGGLSVAWGAGLAVFDESDIVGWPIEAADLKSHYLSVINRIGVAGPLPDSLKSSHVSVPPHPGLHPSASALLSRSNARKRGFRIEPGLHAVLGMNSGGRHACDLNGSCMIGCPNNAVWSAATEVVAMQSSTRFKLFSGLRVDSLRQIESGWTIVCEDGSSFTARHVVCSGGAISTPRLVMPLLTEPPVSLKLLSSPVGAFAVFIPSRLGAPWEKRFFGLAQLQFSQELDSPFDYVFGGLFCGEGIPTRFLAPLISKNTRLSVSLLRNVLPAILFGNVFFDGRYSRHSLTITQDGKTLLTMDHSNTLQTTTHLVTSRLRASFLSLRTMLLPKLIRMAEPGSDLHYAGTLPMLAADKIGATDKWGVPYGLKNLVVLDASVFSSLPPKSHTLTVMANAERIANYWAKRW